MDGRRQLASASVLAFALGLAAPAPGAPRAKAPARVNAPGTAPTGMAVAPDLAVTRAFVGTLDRATNTYRILPATGADAGQQLRIACFFTNTGAGASGSFRVKHVLDGQIARISNPFPPLAGGARNVDGLDVTAGAPGQHRYECTVNFDNASVDRTSANNAAATDFLVLGPAAMTPRERPGPNLPAGPVRPPRVSNVDLIVPQITAQDGFWSTDWQIIGVATVTVTVKNVGMEAAPARAWTWEWVVDGVPRACATSDPRFNLVSGQPTSFGLAQGESRALSFYFKGLDDSEIEALKPGFVRTYQVRVRFNCDLGQAERSETNNESRVVPVWFKARLGVPGEP